MPDISWFVSLFEKIQKSDNVHKLVNVVICLVTLLPLASPLAKELSLDSSQPGSTAIQALIVFAGCCTLYPVSRVFKRILRTIWVDAQYWGKVFCYRYFRFSTKSQVARMYRDNLDVVYVDEVERYLEEHEDTRVQRVYDHYMEAMTYEIASRENFAASFVLLVGQRVTNGGVFQYVSQKLHLSTQFFYIVCIALIYFAMRDLPNDHATFMILRNNNIRRR